MLLLRQMHKWVGLVLGVQFLLWSVSGAAMALLDHRKVSGHATMVMHAPAPAPPANPLGLQAVADRLGAPILQLKLRPLLERYVYEARTPAGVRLVDAVTGDPVRIDAGLAGAIARADYNGPGQVAGVTEVKTASLETRGHDLPLWRVAFSDKPNTTLYVSAGAGEVLERRNDSWRLFDVFWMLHIMDYSKRENFNHPLIITVATGVLWLAITGFIMLFRSFRRSEFSVVLEPAERVGRKLKPRARRRKKR